jgi:hypothetical protein
MKAMICSMLLALGAVGVSARGESEVKPSVAITVSPAHAFAPATLRVRVRVEPDVDNRTVTIVTESDGFFRSSAIQLDGDAHPATFFMEVRHVPGGTYRVTARLDRTGQKAILASQGVTVLGIGGEQ